MSDWILWIAIGINAISAAVWWRANYYAKRARRSSEASEAMFDAARADYLDLSQRLQEVLDHDHE